MTSPQRTDARRPANRLAGESSPYLLQHAHNPVDWYPWGEEALAAARDEDRPIFLSVGYSACHWCHVMERESFEDPEIAGLMNDWFINVKVDREERPDLDQIYMNAVVAMTGGGGWPMSVFLLPDGQPFFGGTYWPPEPRFGRAGFPQILKAVHEAWTGRRGEIESQAGRLTEAVAELSAVAAGDARLSEELLAEANRQLQRHADPTHGGFGRAPKFPHPFDIRVLLRAWKRFGDEGALKVVRLTLDKMAGGGIYDHLGGGFHRYATDARWLVPHFEKMLYDNALLVPAYLEAWQATGDDAYHRVAAETLDYVLREMTSPEGAFYSTQDADSEGEEGKFFVWSEGKIDALLGPERARLFKACYDVSRGGNWEGHNILNRPRPLAECARDLGVDEDELERTLAECRRILFEAREQRVKPGRDEKVLVSWNGLMMAAMAQAASVLGDEQYASAAEDAAEFILTRMRSDDGRLLHAFKDGRARLNGYLDDYACLIDGLVELAQATHRPDARWLTAAVELAGVMIEQFADESEGSGGGFFYTGRDHEQLIVRQKDGQDNATPSGNAMAATALLKLARLTGRDDFEDAAVGTLEMLAPQMERMPAGSGQSLIALDFLLGPTREIVLAPAGGDAAEVLGPLHAHFVPNKVVLVRPPTGDADLPDPLRELLAGKTAHDGQPTLYICEHGTCGAPAVGVEAAHAAIERL